MRRPIAYRDCGLCIFAISKDTEHAVVARHYDGKNHDAKKVAIEYGFIDEEDPEAEPKPCFTYNDTKYQLDEFMRTDYPN